MAAVLFEESICRASEANRTRIVLALDIEDSDPSRLIQRSKALLEQLSDQVCAVKINRQLLLTLGLRNGVDLIVGYAHSLSLPAIMDAKLNDVAHTNEAMMRAYIQAGFDAIIASPVAGWDVGLDSAIGLARKEKRSVILLVHMSNPGSERFYSLIAEGFGKSRPLFEHFAELALQWQVQGVVVGATKSDVVSRVRQIVGQDIKIYSPGVGAQGGDVKSALQSGADYLIVGRSIYSAPDPLRAAREMRSLAPM
jgi:orotidine-5'-phosphate decarboxylase